MKDTHVHIAMSPIKENLMMDIAEFVENGGRKILAQTTDKYDYIETINEVDEINRKYENLADLAIGIHPTIFLEGLNKNDLKDIDIYTYAKKQLDLFDEIFEKNKRKAKAIGEVGLDYFEMDELQDVDNKNIEELKEIQKNTFRHITKLAVENSLPLSIHSRDIRGRAETTNNILEILAHEGKGVVKGVFHSYTGEIDQLQNILDMGFYVGFNAIITYPNAQNVREILREVPLDRILFETDGPFLPTQSIRKNKKESKRYGRPVLIQEIIEYASQIKDIPPKKLEEMTDQNYINLFGN